MLLTALLAVSQWLLAVSQWLLAVSQWSHKMGFVDCTSGPYLGT